MTLVRQKTMQAIALDRFGGIEALKLQNVAVPGVEPGEVLIRVEFAGVGAWDPFEREGGFAEEFGIEPHFPYVLGTDGAGTVAALGEGVEGLVEGDRVYGMNVAGPKGGFYAEFAAVTAENVSLIPGDLATEQAGPMPADALTALQGLDDMLGLREGEAVMVFGAGGGIGHMAVQLAKSMGARVLAVASGRDGVELAEQLGADEAVDGRKDDVVAAGREFAPNGLDAALMTAGGPVADEALQAMRGDGRMAYPNGVDPAPNAPAGVTVRTYNGTPGREAIRKLNRIIESGPFQVHVARVFPLARAADAHRALATHFLGKLALRIR
jgi:NADPH2:quinone reductase